MEKKKTAFFFLIKLGIGWDNGMILAILILANVFESHIYAISSIYRIYNFCNSDCSP